MHGIDGFFIDFIIRKAMRRSLAVLSRSHSLMSLLNWRLDAFVFTSFLQPIHERPPGPPELSIARSTQPSCMVKRRLKYAR